MEKKAKNKDVAVDILGIPVIFRHGYNGYCAEICGIDIEVSYWSQQSKKQDIKESANLQLQRVLKAHSHMQELLRMS